MTKGKILIADSSPEVIQAIMTDPAAGQYEILTAATGHECLQQIAAFHPTLLVIDLMLPEMHGIEILCHLRKNQQMQIGVIITSAQAMIQNYNAALNAGANYFLCKPFSTSFFFTLVERFFRGKLQPDSFYAPPSTADLTSPPYTPRVHQDNRYIKFWGTRGSNAVSGSQYIRYGGNTCCLEVRCGSDLVIIDAGSGIRPLGNTLLYPTEPPQSLLNKEIPDLLEKNPPPVETIHLLIGHTHWDHITGFPFFSPIYKKNCNICIWGPVGFEQTTRKLFTQMLNYTYFPVRLDDMQAQLCFKDLHEERPFTIGSLEIDTHYTYHPGATLCFKIKAAETTFGYVTDNEMLMGYHGCPTEITAKHPLLEPHQSLISFFRGCNLLIHEAQYFPEEYQSKVGWGHSSLANASALLMHTHIPEWIVTHHDPAHSDEELDRKRQMLQDILTDCHIPCRLQLAYDTFKVLL